MSKARRAFTLIEVMLTGTLTLLLLGTLIGLLIPAMRISAQNAVRVELQQEGVMAVHRIANELQQTSASGVGIRLDPPVLSLHRVVDLTTSTPPTQVFDRQLIIFGFRSGEGRIFRRLWPPVPGAGDSLDGKLNPPDSLSAVRPAQSSLQFFAQNPSPDEIALARDVTKFSVTSQATPPQVMPPIFIEITLERPVAGRAPIQFQMKQSVSLRHSE